MTQVLLLCLGCALFALSFMVVLNSPEVSNRLYPGSNVRFLASAPSALLFVFTWPWLITLPPDIDWLKWLALIGICVLYIWYSAWIESRFRGGIIKHILKAQVVDKQGKNISFKVAVWRNIFKLLLFPLAPISLLLLMKDYRHRALHDKLSGSFVMWTSEAIQEMQPKSSYEVNIR